MGKNLISRQAGADLDAVCGQSTPRAALSTHLASLNPTRLVVRPRPRPYTLDLLHDTIQR